MAILKNIKNNLTNIPGWRTQKKLVVFESDDWGSNRMPSVTALNNLEKKGINLKHLKYATLDSLEKKQDLEALADILISSNHSDNRPIFTTNMVMGNPDYENIYNHGFSKFYHQNLWDPYKYYYGMCLESLWKDSIAQGVFSPQYHAKQHLNTRLWMKDLMIGRKKTRTAFSEKFYGLVDGTSSPYQKNYLMEYYVESAEDLEELKLQVEIGIQMFKEFFQIPSKTIVACNYAWPLEIELFLKNLGIVTIQGQRGHLVPQPLKKGKAKIRRHYTGQKNEWGQNYTVRNVLFEPFENQNYDWVNSAMKDISCSFLWNRPAIISTHRVNYVSNMSIKNRDDSLRKLKELLKSIIKKWPDAQFISSAKLSHLMNI